jgi:hypothetical protein
MKRQRTEILQRIEKLLTVDDSQSHWLGYCNKHGWLLLDRELPGNDQAVGGPSRLLRFIRLRDWKIVRTPLLTWHDGSIRFYRSIEATQELEAVELVIEEWRRRRTTLVAIKEWKAVAGLLHKQAVNATQFPPPASEDDLRLCLIWMNEPVSSEHFIFDELLERLLLIAGLYDACRLLSARRAEMLVGAFYSQLGLEVRDISITQLTEPDKGDWKNFDLDVGYPLDVKNARSTYNGKQHFAEHAVVRFKNARDSGHEVRIVGVWSPYINRAESAARGFEQPATVLGEVGLLEIERLTAWMARRFGRIVKTTALWDPSRVPGWFFEYPDIYYCQRAAAVQLMFDLVAKHGDDNHMKVGQWLIAEAHGVTLPSNFSATQLVIEIRDMLVTCGLAKRCLILYGMCSTLEAALTGTDADGLLLKIREIFLTGLTNDECFPLGLYDPLGYVERFFGVFEYLAISVRQFADEIAAFHLTGPNILLATMNDGRRLTFLAYCGGWIESKGRCGYAPLVAGCHPHCEACGKLICPNCNHCTELCELGKERKRKPLTIGEAGAWEGYTETFE